MFVSSPISVPPGDGGNDVSMIQAADCGIGIEGKVRVPSGHRVVCVLPAGPALHTRVTGEPAAPSTP